MSLIRPYGIFSSILFLWPCLSVVTGEAIKDVELSTIQAEQISGQKTEALQVEYTKDLAGKEIIVTRGLFSIGTVETKDLINVYTSNPKDDEIPAMLGKVILKNNHYEFHSVFPFQAGLRYFIEVNPESTIKRELFTFRIPRADQTAVTKVSAVYPSASELPENLLKFYLHFSHPMSVGNVYQHIHLLDENGDAVELPFLEIGEELWDYDSRRLTLLFDPGRIKSGLVPNLEEGLALSAGHTYTLQIDQDWLDGEGRPLVEGCKKSFAVVTADTVSPNPYNWQKRWPGRNTRDPVVLSFPESLDEALLQRVVRIVDKNGSVLDGSIRVENNEMQWAFKPEANWRSGAYRVAIDTILEDVAGNSIARPFEVDQNRSEQYREGPKTVYLDFKIN